MKVDDPIAAREATERALITAAETCDAEAAGYDGWFSIYCDLPKGHDGLHCYGNVEWRSVTESERAQPKLSPCTTNVP